MIIAVYSGTRASTVSRDLGKADYSYYFILQKYLPLLRALGEVRFVDNPALEVDAIYAEAQAAGAGAIFLSFTPPHNTQRGLRCPTVCVMAWEFGSIPDEDWDSDGPSPNWVTALRDIGNVITISDYATRVIRRQVGSGVRVVTIPAPVDAAEPDQPAPAGLRGTTRPALQLAATLVDSRQCDIDEERVTVRSAGAEAAGRGEVPWDGTEVNWAFVSKGESAGQYLVGFYAEEDWGCWSRTPTPEIILPWQVQGDFELELSMVGYGENQGRTIEVRIGDCTRSLQLTGEMRTFPLRFSLPVGASSIHFCGLTAVPLPGARDHRTLGLGLSKLPCGALAPRRHECRRGPAGGARRRNRRRPRQPATGRHGVYLGVQPGGWPEELEGYRHCVLLGVPGGSGENPGAEDVAPQQVGVHGRLAAAVFQIASLQLQDRGAARISGR